MIDVEPDTVVARQGGPADKFFIVVDGELEVTREDGGSTETVATARAGRPVRGDGDPVRPAARDQRAARPSRRKLLVLDSDTFRSVVAQSLGTTPDFDQIIRDRIGAASRAPA